MDVFLLAGQSNMAGRGGVTRAADGSKRFETERPLEYDARIEQRVQAFSPTRGWQEAREPMHQEVDDQKVCGVGPGIPFAQHLLDRRLAQAVGLVPTAVGATAISEWLPGTRLFQQMIRLTQEALEAAPEARLQAMLWYQGESDCETPEQAASWPERFAAVVEGARAELKDRVPGGAQLPVIMVVITGTEARLPCLAETRRTQQHLALPGVFKVDADGLELQEDGVHLTTAAQLMLAQRLADCYGSSVADKRAGAVARR